MSHREDEKGYFWSTFTIVYLDVFTSVRIRIDGFLQFDCVGMCLICVVAMWYVYWFNKILILKVKIEYFDETKKVKSSFNHCI